MSAIWMAVMGCSDPVPTVVVDEYRTISEGPAPVGDAALTMTPGPARIDLTIDRFVSYCAPDPSFVAERSGDVLTLTVVRPEEGVSRCFGTHAVDLHVDLHGAEPPRTVVLEGYDGKRLAEVTGSGSEAR